MAPTRAEEEVIMIRFSVALFLIGLVLVGLSVHSTLAIVGVHRTKVRNHRIQEISLRNFSVSNLNIIDDQISGDWTIGLSLKNPARKTAVYTDIKFTVALSTAPDLPIVDFHLGYPTVQRPNKRTAVYLHGSAEKLPLNHMTVDGIDAGAVEFDLIVAVKCKNEDMLDAGRLDLTCKGIEVLFSPPPSKSALLNATGCATEIPVCNLVKSRVFDF